MAFFKVFFLHVNLILARLKLVFHNNTKLPGQNKQNSYFNVRCNILYEIELQQDQWNGLFFVITHLRFHFTSIQIYVS